ncbi:hypothetical protein HOS13_gp09 [Caulobacter phage Lullwater]|uniref:Uncharacterized protein n=1 Tax=Caulobacter phage Lullwater TaxID=2024607 RepID=A0A291LB81_9CAUD|nr:hypothetical protein HOS13_gp09 [Caulobacter phage Lullwater]ATI16316.1 hypothetical protein Lull_009 [Caulobacter phage Lullwater]
MTEVAEKTVKTTAQKLEAAKAYVLKLEAQLKAEVAANDVRIGDTVKFFFGRAEKRRELTGTVSARKDADEETPTTLLKVDVGSGFDATSYRLRISDIAENVSAGQRDAEGQDGSPLSEA